MDIVRTIACSCPKFLLNNNYFGCLYSRPLIEILHIIRAQYLIMLEDVVKKRRIKTIKRNEKWCEFFSEKKNYVRKEMKLSCSLKTPPWAFTRQKWIWLFRYTCLISKPHPHFREMQVKCVHIYFISAHSLRFFYEH